MSGAMDAFGGQTKPTLLNVVLMQPEIPQNTGNIARTCACLGANLHLVHPMGFHLTERNIKRSGMDYFEHVDLTQWASTEQFLDAHAKDMLVLFTGHASKRFDEVNYASEQPIYLVFGRESTGIDEDVLQRFQENCVRIPMLPERRSLNLANSVAIGLYEAVRQRGFEGMV